MNFKSTFIVIGLVFCMFSISSFARGPVDESLLRGVPTIELRSYTGWTGYIDFLTPKDFPVGWAIEKFTDAAKRKGIVIRYSISAPVDLTACEIHKYALKGKTEEELKVEIQAFLKKKTAPIYTTAFFQRYTDNSDFWVGGGHFGLSEFVGDSKYSFSDESLAELIRNRESTWTMSSLMFSCPCVIRLVPNFDLLENSPEL